MCGDYKSCAWKIGDPLVPEVDDEFDHYLNQALAVPPDPIGEIELYPTPSFSVGLISLGNPVSLKPNVPQQSKPVVVGLEFPQHESKTVVALEDTNFDYFFSDDCSQPRKQKAEKKLQAPPQNYYRTNNMENEGKREQCPANVDVNNMEKTKVENKDEKQYYFTNPIGYDETVNCFNFINNNNKLEGIESNVLFTKKKRRSKRGSKSKQQNQWSWNFGLEDDQNKPPNYMTTRRMCRHCKTDETPQWRVGPSGPKTLCNACGVRYKSGRLLPEYRPASSPTFDTLRHSNFHRKIIKRREDDILHIAS